MKNSNSKVPAPKPAPKVQPPQPNPGLPSKVPGHKSGTGRINILPAN